MVVSTWILNQKLKTNLFHPFSTNASHLNEPESSNLQTWIKPDIREYIDNTRQPCAVLTHLNKHIDSIDDFEITANQWFLSTNTQIPTSLLFYHRQQFKARRAALTVNLSGLTSVPNSKLHTEFTIVWGRASKLILSSPVENSWEQVKEPRLTPIPKLLPSRRLPTVCTTIWGSQG